MAARGDPVRELIEQYRGLCERAVDPLDIAVGLEEAGLDAGEAAKYRHADVFSLAEELFARVPRRPVEPAPVLREAPRRRRWTVAGLGYGIGLALLLVLPLGRADPAGRALALAAALGLGPAEWSARWLRQAGRLQLGSARTIAEFRSRMRPVLPVALALHLAVLALFAFVALAVLTVLSPRPGAPGGLLRQAAHRAPPLSWTALALLGALLLLAVVLRLSGRTAVAALGLLAGAVPPPPLGCAAAVAVLLPCTWVLLGRPETYRRGP